MSRFFLALKLCATRRMSGLPRSQGRFELGQGLQHGGATSFDGAFARTELGAAHPHQIGMHHQISFFELKGVDALAHDGEGLQQNFEHVAGFVALGRAGNIDGQHIVCAHLRA